MSSVPTLSSDPTIQQLPLWRLNPELIDSVDLQGRPFAILDPDDLELQKISEIYARSPVPNYEIDTVKVIYNPRLEETLVIKLQRLEARSMLPAVFAPRWNQENDSEDRRRIIELLENISEPYDDSDFSHLKILPVWVDFEESKSKGFWETSLLSSYEPEYAYQKFCNNEGPLLCGFAFIFSAYPVTPQDPIGRLEWAQFENYDAHLYPTTGTGKLCEQLDQHKFTVIQLFQSTFLPRYLIGLKPISSSETSS